jgi:PAS domain S-box-containing protein
VIWISASGIISQHLSSDFSASLMAIVLGGSVVLLLMELVHAYVAGWRRARETLEQRNRELTALNSVSATITATLDLEEVLQRIVDTVVALFPQATSATLQLADDEHSMLRTVTASPNTIPDRGEKSMVFRTGEGIAGQAMAERRSKNVIDVNLTPGYLPGDGPPAYRSLLVTPLVVGQRVWGTLSLAGKAPGAFESSDERLVESFAQQAAIAIENAHLYQETTRRAQEQETVSSVVRALNASLDVERAFPSVVKGLKALAECERISLTLLDDQNQEFTVIALSTAVPGLGRGKTFPYSASAGMHDLRAGRAHLTPDLSAESEYPIRQILLEAGFRSAVNLPLIAGNEVIGALNIGSKRLATFDENNLPLFRQIADALAASIVQSDLFDRVHSAESQYRGLFENSPDAIAILDSSGVLIDVNPAACQIAGRTREELISRNIGVINDVPQPRFRKAIEQALGGKPVVYEFGTLVANKMRYYEAHVARVEQETGASLLWVAHDVTGRRELDHWREELTGITVHNLRNPLTWVQTGTMAARMFLPEDTDPDVFTALDKAIKGTSRLEQQIDLLLNINRAEAGQELTDQEPVIVPGLVNDVIELLSPRAGAHRVRLCSEIPETVPVVLGNRNMLSWSLENLVDNAIKFSPEKKEVIVRASVIATPVLPQPTVPDGPTDGKSEVAGGTTEPPRGTALHISVIDRGPGIPPSDRERIFRKFHQVRRPEGKKGSGMGLYFCRLAVEAHGGRLWVDNNLEGPGCTFTFTLPLPAD